MFRFALSISRKRNGFSLVEAVLSITLLLVTALMFAATAPVASRAATINGEYSQAVSFCQHKIDQCRQMGYGRLTYSDFYNTGMIDANPTSAPFSFTSIDNLDDSNLAQVTGTINVTTPATSLVTGANYKEVTVTVTWVSGTFKRKTNSVSLVAEIMQSE